jgi:hypothetical protein
MSLFVDIPEDRKDAWFAAVRAQFHAQDVGTARAWAGAGRAWDAMAKLYSPSEHDRGIYVGLAKDAWVKAVGPS